VGGGDTSLTQQPISLNLSAHAETAEAKAHRAVVASELGGHLGLVQPAALISARRSAGMS
jgi:hypothetical protein